MFVNLTTMYRVCIIVAVTLALCHLMTCHFIHIAEKLFNSLKYVCCYLFAVGTMINFMCCTTFTLYVAGLGSTISVVGLVLVTAANHITVGRSYTAFEPVVKAKVSRLFSTW